MLFDTQSDPWCLNNLANDPAHTGRAATMLAELENLMLRDLDLGLYLSLVGRLFGAGFSLRRVVLGLRAAQAALRLLFHLCLVLLRIVSHN
jgi:hypothetical protein